VYFLDADRLCPVRSVTYVSGRSQKFNKNAHSPRLFVEGNVYGMYFFGYGNFVSFEDTLGITINKHFSVGAGYALASRLNVNGSKDRLAFDLTQKGPLVGVQLSF